MNTRPLEALLAETELVGALEFRADAPLATIEVRKTKDKRTQAPELIIVRVLRDGRQHTTRVIGKFIPEFVALVVEAGKQLVPSLATQTLSEQKRKERRQNNPTPRGRRDDACEGDENWSAR